MSRRTVALVLLSAFILFGLTATAFAQGAANSSLNGTVVDSSGGVMPGATIVAHEDARAFTVRKSFGDSFSKTLVLQ